MHYAKPIGHIFIEGRFPPNLPRVRWDSGAEGFAIGAEVE
jgi:hypothetical protein